MNKIIRWTLILAACILAFYFTFNFNIYFEEFKRRYYFAGDWLSLIMLLALMIAIGGIFRWFVKQEIRMTK